MLTHNNLRTIFQKTEYHVTVRGVLKDVCRTYEMALSRQCKYHQLFGVDANVRIELIIK